MDLRLILGLGLIGLGVGMLCLGVFHGFEHGSCSTTGYSRNYGPVPRCSKGVGWWVLMIFAGLIVAGGGAVLARSVGAIMVPLVFVAIGAPFIALALGHHGQLLFNSSSSAGKIFAGVFGGAFVIAGLVWGVFAARGITGVNSGSLLGGLLLGAVGVGGAFAIAGGVSSAIGKTTTPSSFQAGGGVTVLSAPAEKAREIALCKSLVAGQNLVSAHVKASLTAECAKNWKAAEHAIPAAAKKAALASIRAQCSKQTTSAGAGLPASARSTLGGALKADCKSAGTGSQSASSGSGLKTLQKRLCIQIVKAKVPAFAQKQALASCNKF